MLEVLKPLQIKPQADARQVNICNQKIAGDCFFLEAFLKAFLGLYNSSICPTDKRAT